MEVRFANVLFEQLEVPLKSQGYGGPDVRRDNPFAKVRAYIADSPVAHSLKDILDKLGQPVPPAIDLYKAYDVWMIPNRVNVIKDGGIAEPVLVGIEVEYRNDSAEVNLNRRMTCCVISVLPPPEYRKLGDLSGGIHGELSPSGEVSSGTENLLLLKEAPLSANLKIGLGAELKVNLNFNFKVEVPLVSAVGIGSARAEWVFKEESVNLYGKDIETWTMVALPKLMTELRYRVRLYLVLRTAFFSTRHESDWKEISCRLIDHHDYRDDKDGAN